VKERLQRVHERLAEAAARAGRAPDAVRVVAVSKLHPAAAIDAAFEAGVRDVGENYAQELADKLERCAHAGELRWHFIGRLQRNKARVVVGAAASGPGDPRCALIHAVDSERLAIEIDKRAAAAGVVQPILFAVNVAGEASKTGVEPGQVEGLVATCAALPAVDCAGLMTMPPLADDPEEVRGFFRALRELRDRLRDGGAALGPELSMGTTGDFEVAVEEGATLVRIGTAIFGPRPAG
jgi:PLP dependent protein